ncbi:hypothetical protein BACT_1235 [Bifidobacterium actinocoloniiforme DSM 22766]|uniref:Acyltransferase 3 domain-containing protein n=1 Tax=Bifidobacterium actinocoloniiforme DSM 22766 TaxID=1437605 RepID=A0A086Z1Y1_9BIFI|nr:acyltransferase [Bifidobacterium actinocoloniiforme]AKV55625.1 hypothetical protein AB656_04800 [Bifidobacterium actinocoloniiforme DSM 22766]KFI40531.1 hypothetical protein BACT_1235 [Bifidobacterium actinocoloniiforme DSM 22766]
MANSSQRHSAQNPRNINIELLRIFAMVLVVLCHAVIHLDVGNSQFRMELAVVPGWKNAIRFTAVQYGQVGVSIFFMISGFFLSSKTFSWRRVFLTWSQAFLYTTLCFFSILIYQRFSPLPAFLAPLMQGSELKRTALWSFFPFLYDSYWFIDAYIVMLLFVPFINLVMRYSTKRQLIALIALLAFLGTWPLFFNQTNHWNNVTYAIICYLIGGFIHQELSRVRETRPLVLSALIATSTIAMTLFNYIAASRSSVITALGWPALVKQGLQVLPILIASCLLIAALKMAPRSKETTANTVIRAVAKSTFGVYLLHENIFGFRILWTAVARFMPHPSGLIESAILLIIIVIAVFLLLDGMAFLLDSLLIHPCQKLAFAAIDRHKALTHQE